MSLIESIVDRFLEDPEERRRKERDLVKKCWEDAKKKKAVFDQPVKSKDYWKPGPKSNKFNEIAALGGKHPKDSRYLATATSRANSYGSILEIYSSIKQK
eukprot:snap_masked-scaffold_16-processed-gene-4.32-mRNA-1 protein AED:1.00 eAED:1.00 QI:0/-1/0/0/-1/1/1/0/99